MIDTHLLDTYIAELEAFRTHGRDLAEAHPDLAGRLDIGSRRSRDPHVERIVESTAFLAARLRLMMETNATELPLAALSPARPGPRGAGSFDGAAAIERGQRAAGPCLEGHGSTMKPVARRCRASARRWTPPFAPMTLRLRRFEPTSGSPGRHRHTNHRRSSGTPPLPDGQRSRKLGGTHRCARRGSDFHPGGPPGRRFLRHPQ